MDKQETRACWYRVWARGTAGPWLHGHFHQWGSEQSSCDGDGCYTVGIVEDAEGGNIYLTRPEDVCFGIAHPRPACGSNTRDRDEATSGTYRGSCG